jgi:predicted phage terminase large subunit-like protein
MSDAPGPSSRTFDAQDRQAAAITARADLYFFSRWMFLQRKGFKWQRALHHKLICDALMRVFSGECKRLIINIPPRYSKTELAVVNFIAWAFGKVPDAEFIHASYSGALAINNSSAVRGLVQHDAFGEIFPGLSLSGEAAHHWKTTAGGVMYAVGTGGTITGFGAGKHRPGFGGAIIIDDPHKADEARSDVIRQGVIDWFQTTLESRKNSPDTPIIVIMQRLHEKDLAGWLLNGGNGEKWDHLCLSAVNDDGSPLWPEKHTRADLERMERAAPYVFAGQYRQQPSPPAGGVIKPDMLQVVDAIPAGRVTWLRGWDFAATEESAKASDPDWTAGGKLGKLQDGRFIIADMVRFREGPDVRDQMLRNTAARDGRGTKQSLPQDPGAAGKSQVLYLTRQLAGYPVASSPESGDKVLRAEPLAAQINVGNVLMLRGPWNDELINEMRMFPNGAHDDQVDALSRAFTELEGGNTGMLDYLQQLTQQAQARKEEPPNGT